MLGHLLPPLVRVCHMFMPRKKRETNYPHDDHDCHHYHHHHHYQIRLGTHDIETRAISKAQTEAANNNNTRKIVKSKKKKTPLHRHTLPNG